MKHVICTLPHASDLINNIPFQDHAEGKVTVDPVDDEVAARFASIPGYKVLDTEGGPANPETPLTPAAGETTTAQTPVEPAGEAAAEATGEAAAAVEAAVTAIETAVAAADAAPAEVKKNPVPANFQKKTKAAAE